MGGGKTLWRAKNTITLCLFAPDDVLLFQVCYERFGVFEVVVGAVDCFRGFRGQVYGLAEMAKVEAGPTEVYDTELTAVLTVVTHHVRHGVFNVLGIGPHGCVYGGL